jgi:hypothetical protein
MSKTPDVDYQHVRKHADRHIRFRFNIRDIEMMGYAIERLNDMAKTNYTMEDITKYQDIFYIIHEVQKGTYLPNLDLEQQLGTFFGYYGRDAMSGEMEYVYIFAFILGAKEFIGRHKCVYSADSGFTEFHYVNGKKVEIALTSYQLLRYLVEYANRNRTMDVPYVSDPYPGYEKYPYVDANVCKEGPCGDIGDCKTFRAYCDEKTDFVKNPCCKDQTRQEKCLKASVPSIVEEYTSDASPKSSHYHLYKQLICAGVAALLFIILSSQQLKKMTANLFGCNDDMCNVIHGVVFFALFFCIYRYLLCVKENSISSYFKNEGYYTVSNTELTDYHCLDHTDCNKGKNGHCNFMDKGKSRYGKCQYSKV